MNSVVATPITVTGTGLITGQPVTVTCQAQPVGHGVVFDVNGAMIPADVSAVVSTDRGVTLAKDGQVLSIVEHFLSACAMLGLEDVVVTVSGAPEMPLLDGSAAAWADVLQPLVVPVARQPRYLSQAVTYTDPHHPQTWITATPHDGLRLTYLLDFPHPGTERRWFTWEAPQEADISAALLQDIGRARTFGFADDLPALQARGLALGVTVENTLGLTAEGGYTSELRMPDEPLRHKILDLIGDLMLCGVPVLGLRAHIIASCAGHGSHTAFGPLLKQALH